MSHWFRTGGALIDLQRLGCLPVIVCAGMSALALALLIVILIATLI